MQLLLCGLTFLLHVSRFLWHKSFWKTPSRKLCFAVCVHTVKPWFYFGLLLLLFDGIFSVYINVRLLSHCTEDERRQMAFSSLFINFILQCNTQKSLNFIVSPNTCLPLALCHCCCWAISCKVPFLLVFRLLIGLRVPALRGYIVTSWFLPCAWHRLKACRCVCMWMRLF